MENIVYDVDYFIKKFKAIDDRDIGTGNLSSHCSLWHCGLKEPMMYEYPTEEAKALNNLFRDNANDYIKGKLQLNPNLRGPIDLIWLINDDSSNNIIVGSSPKQRILNYLKQIKDNHQV